MTADEAVRTARIVIALSDGLTARVITGGLTGEEAITAALDTLADLSGIEE